VKSVSVATASYLNVPNSPTRDCPLSTTLPSSCPATSSTVENRNGITLKNLPVNTTR